MENSDLIMDNVYQKLEDIGFSKEFVRTIGLPSWWVEELDEKNIAVFEACLHISKRLCIELKSLLDPEKKVKFKRGMNYEKVVQLHRYTKKYVINYPLREEEIELLSPDSLDYYEQVVNFKF